MTASACGPTREMLSAHLDGDLAPEFEAAVRAHLAGCAACRAELELLRLTVGALRSLPELPAPAGLLAGVRAGIAAPPRRAGFFSRIGRGWIVGVPIGAIASLVVVFGIAFFQERHPELRQQAAAPGAGETPVPAPARAPVAVPEAASGPAPAPTAAIGLDRAAPPPPAVSKPAPPRKRAAPAMERKELPPPPVAQAPAPAPQPPAEPPAAFRAAADAPAPAPAPAPAAPAPQIFEARKAQLEESAPPPSRFVVPEQETPPEARAARFGAKAAGGRLADERADRDDGYRAPAPRLAGIEREPAASRAEARSRQGTSLVGSVAKKQDAPAREAIEVLYLLTRDGEDLDELRRILKREGGSLLEVRALDPERQREAVAPLLGQHAAARSISRGWRIEAKVPRRNFKQFLDAVGAGTRYEIMQREPAPEDAGRDPEQNVRINLFR